MHINIFYSWQSDLPNKLNRSFIHECLEQAVKGLSNSGSFHIELRVDKDTQNVEGAPDIVDTIFEKIQNSQIFVADISIINLFTQETGRKVPNPNVLLELGYAAANIGWENVLLIYNLDFGRIEDLPFDLKMRRPITYRLSGESLSNKDVEKKNLVRVLSSSIYEISKNNARLFQNQLAAKLYHLYSSKITNIYLKCDSLLENLCAFFDLEQPETGINPPDKNQIESICKSINSLILNEELDEDTEFKELGNGITTTFFSKYIKKSFNKLFKHLIKDIELILQFKEGINFQIISLLGQILAISDSSKILISTKNYSRIQISHTNSSGQPVSENRIACVRYYTLNSERFLALMFIAYELKMAFKEHYSFHQEAFSKQEQDRFNKYDTSYSQL